MSEEREEKEEQIGHSQRWKYNGGLALGAEERVADLALKIQSSAHAPRESVEPLASTTAAACNASESSTSPLGKDASRASSAAASEGAPAHRDEASDWEAPANGAMSALGLTGHDSCNPDLDIGIETGARRNDCASSPLDSGDFSSAATTTSELTIIAALALVAEQSERSTRGKLEPKGLESCLSGQEGFIGRAESGEGVEGSSIDLNSDRRAQLSERDSAPRSPQNSARFRATATEGEASRSLSTDREQSPGSCAQEEIGPSK